MSALAAILADSPTKEGEEELHPGTPDLAPVVEVHAMLSREVRGLTDFFECHSLTDALALFINT